MSGTVLLVGTRKGLWIGTSDEAREDWKFTGPHHNMEEVYSCMVDTRSDPVRLFAGASSSWLGPQVKWSDDLGETWQETPGGAIKFPEGTDASVERVWQLVPGIEDGTVWAGTEPGAVWRSTDRGATFSLEQQLWDHPHRKEWGAGFGGQAFHTILPHPSDPASVTVAISSGGVYQTDDDGASWAPRNQGVRAEFLPEGEQYPEFGQCVHKMSRHPSRPERLFMQNHGGVYRSDDHARSWNYIADRLPADFGFPVVVHPHEPDTVFVFPLSGERRSLPTRGQGQGLALPRRRRHLGGARQRAARRLLRRRDARRHVRGRPPFCRAVRRRPQRRGVGVRRHWGELAPGRGQPAGRDGGAGRGVLTLAPAHSRVTESAHG